MSANRLVTLLGIGMVITVATTFYLFAGRPPQVTPGQTVTDPGVEIMNYGSGIKFLSHVGQVVIPLNWHEIPQVDRPIGTSTSFRTTPAGKSIAERTFVFSEFCERQTGAKITALEQFENEVLVKYSNPERKNDSYNCPTGVVFWMSVENFQKADSEYEEVMEIKGEQDKAEQKKHDKEQRKLDVVRHHVSPPPGGWV